MIFVIFSIISRFSDIFQFIEILQTFWIFFNFIEGCGQFSREFETWPFGPGSVDGFLQLDSDAKRTSTVKGKTI